MVDRVRVDAEDLLRAGIHAKAATLAVFRLNAPMYHVIFVLLLCLLGDIETLWHHTTQNSTIPQLVSSTNYKGIWVALFAPFISPIIIFR